MTPGSGVSLRAHTSWVKPVAGLSLLVAIALVVLVATGLFRGSFTESVSVTVMTDRAGLVMNPAAKVKMLDVEVGRVGAIENLPDGGAVVHLQMDPAQLHVVPSNVMVDIASSTVFGSKFVQLLPPDHPSPEPLRAGQVLDSRHVTVEINTVFEQLTTLLAEIDPAKLGATLHALSSALSGRGERFGEALSDLDTALIEIEPALPALARDLSLAPTVLNSYADAAPDLVQVLSNASRLSESIVAKQHELDEILVSVVGFADAGTAVVDTNRPGLVEVLRLLVPTTDLTNEYNRGLTCALQGIVPLANLPPSPDPGVLISAGLVWGPERYRYPSNLPKVAATGGPHCLSLPNVQPGERPPFLVTDIGANPAQYGHQGFVVNSDALKEALFGPIDGPPRNSAQIGQPG